MVGGISLVVDSHTSPCLCLDSLTSKTHMNHKNSEHKSGGKSQLFRPGLELKSSFVHSNFNAKTPSFNKQKKAKGLVVVNELGGQYEDSFRDVQAQLFNLFTYKAVRTVMNQLYEMNPTEYRWFYDFVVVNKPNDGKRFLRVLQKEKHELAERVMVTRLHLYGKWIKKVDHAEMYKNLSDQNLELMRERLMETVIWPSDDAANWDNFG
ncbi:chaperonin-like RbcX protein 2, chloroplastic [Rutidosis leptorrhynchoides]|uniref:chaperonin-like RbcX protein 2, chloroplastic n=1 Tax=Rutidosis leptorrhynchoides TaxID=125765 RepID=UPI003A9A0DA7